MKSFYLALSSMMISAVLGLTPSYASNGTVILARGVITATGVDKASRLLAKGEPIEEGDIINTANKSFAVIRMLDNTKLTLKPGTTVAIGKFSIEKGKEEACINLVKGGLRTVTGLIGKRKPDSFKVDTPIASIGIRGTDFVTRICAGDECLADEQELGFGEIGGASQAPKKSQSSEIAELINEQLPEGLYGSCETGAIVMSKCAGQSEGFEMGSCRVTQQKDCTDVGIDAGVAAYASFEPVATASPVSPDGTVPPAGNSESKSTTSAVGQSAASQNGRGSSVSDSQSSGVSGAGLAARAGSAPIVLDRTPRILNKDPYFALSDLSDGDLDKVDIIPDSLGSGGGQCSIYGG